MAAVALTLLDVGQAICWGQAPPAPMQGINKVCTIYFGKDVQRPARIQDSARECLTHAISLLHDEPATQLYLVATADSEKDNRAGNGTSRTEQDMTGEDLRYADVAAYRAVNIKAYMVRWLHASPKSIVPMTLYETGQWVEIYDVKKGIDFKSSFGKKTAPIIERPCTTGPCAARFEEFLVAQQRGRIPK